MVVMDDMDCCILASFAASCIWDNIMDRLAFYDAEYGEAKTPPMREIQLHCFQSSQSRETFVTFYEASAFGPSRAEKHAKVCHLDTQELEYSTLLAGQNLSCATDHMRSVKCRHAFRQARGEAQ